MSQPTSPSSPPAQDDAFYVNYLPVPSSLRRFVVRGAFALIALTTVAAIVVAALQGDPGGATWAIDNVVEIEGTIMERPYPILRRLKDDGGVESILLIGEGKHGVSERVMGMNGRQARLRGTILQRDGRRLFELVTSDDAVIADAGTQSDLAASLSPVAGSTHLIHLKGEIIDPKCYLGAMKPGHGKTHKACAALCLRGGIPPMFVTQNNDGSRQYHLLTGADGGPVTGPALEYLITHVGELIELTGRLEQAGDLSLMRIEVTQLR